MRHVYLPVEHSDDDLTLAGQVAECLESRSLYVTWSGLGYQHPDVETLWRPVEEEAPPRAPEAAAASPLHGLLTEAIGTMVAFVAALTKPRTA